jgi:glycosyltransferase involved in cell wall biosynthesis
MISQVLVDEGEVAEHLRAVTAQPGGGLICLAGTGPVGIGCRIAAVTSGSAAANLIRTADCGIVVAPEDARALVDGIERIRRDAEMCRRMGGNGRRYAIEKFSKAGVLKQWDALLAELVPRGGARSD